MFTSLTSRHAKIEIENKRLVTLVQEALENPNPNAKHLLKDIRHFIEKGANLNQLIPIHHSSNSKNNKTLIYLLLMHIPDFHFAQEILELGGDPRILNDDKSNLFLAPPKGRGYFMQVCWLDFININLDIGNNHTFYGDIIKTALLIYKFCTIQEIQTISLVSSPNDLSDQALQVYKKLDYFEKHLNDLQLADLQKIQSTYLTYSLAFGKCPVIQFDVLPKHDERQCRKVVRF